MDVRPTSACNVSRKLGTKARGLLGPRKGIQYEQASLETKRVSSLMHGGSLPRSTCRHRRAKQVSDCHEMRLHVVKQTSANARPATKSCNTSVPYCCPNLLSTIYSPAAPHLDSLWWLAKLPLETLVHDQGQNSADRLNDDRSDRQDEVSRL